MSQEIVGIKIVVDGQDANKQTNATVGNIRQQLKEANAELIAAQKNFGEYSKEAVAAAQKVAQLRDSVQEARETADLFDPGKKFQAFSGALSAVAGGFSAVQGALGLLGVESADVEKQLLKVQSALALSQGLSTITDSVKDFQRLGAVLKTFGPIQQANAVANRLAASTMTAFGVAVNTTSTAFRVLKVAIAATGIGLLVVAIGSVVEAFSNYTSAAEKAKKAQEDFNETTKRLAQIGLKAELEGINRSQQLLEAQARARGDNEKKINELQQQGIDLRLQSQKRAYEELKNVDAEAAEDALNEIKNLETEKQVAQLNFQAAERERAKQANAQRAADGKQRQDQLRQDREKEAEIEREYQKKLEDQERAAVEKRRDQIASAEKILQDAQRQAFLNRLQGRDRELAELDFKLQDELAKVELNEIAQRDIIEAFAIQRKEINEKFDREDRERAVAAQAEKIGGLQRELEIRQEAARQTVLLEQQKTDAIIAGAREITNVLGGLTQLVGRNTAAAKVLNIAQATIDTYASVASIFAQAAKNPVTIPFPAYPYIQAGAALVAGLARVRAITSVQVPFGGGGGGSAPGAPASAAAPIPPAIPLTQTVTQLQSGTINQLQSATTRAYVVESDVTGAQERIRRINRAARLG